MLQYLEGKKTLKTKFTCKSYVSHKIAFILESPWNFERELLSFQGLPRNSKFLIFFSIYLKKVHHEYI